MARKKLSRNAPCPCGSGRKYKHCCALKAFEYLEADDGAIFKSIPMSDEVKAVLEEQRRKFVEQHGREPGPDDQVFFDMPHPEHVEHLMVEAMKQAGINPAFIYAYEKTGGLLVTEQNEHLLSDADLDEWQAAIDEYEAMHQFQQPPRYPIGTVAFYGPNDRVITKIAAGVIVDENAAPIIERWVGTDVATSPKVQEEMKAFFRQHGVHSVAMSDGNMGCPHEEGLDFPQGEDCPFCPFWKGKQGSNRKE